LTQQDLGLLGDSFTRVWSIDETPSFRGLLEAIDEADRDLWRGQDRRRRGDLTDGNPG
jgi:hypothetical protein